MVRNAAKLRVSNYEAETSQASSFETALHASSG
jgi:hypothetical protein